MMYIDPHIHMSSRTTDDYQMMRDSGIVAVIEPAFWMGQPRTNIGSFQDYFSSLIGWERFRSAQFGIKHYCTIGLNSKEANNEALAEQVMELLPLYACKEGVVAIGEIGYDDMTPAEDKYFRQQLELARLLDMLVLIHTPHRDKKAGTSRSMDVCIEHGLDPSRVIVDHNNEQTVEEVLDRGFWAAFTIYPHTKMGNARMVEIVRQYGMLERGIPESDVQAVCYQNAIAAYSQSGQMQESDWLNPAPIDQRQLFSGNSVLRGQQPLVQSTRDYALID
jgi:uncharacterized protein